MPGSSLARRLFVLIALWSALSLASAGFVLITAYRSSVEAAFDERLAVHLKTLIGALAAQADGAGTFRQPENPGEARFELPLSGWYWVVRRVSDDGIAAISRSLVGEVLRLPGDLGATAGRDHILRAYSEGPDRQHLRILERIVDFDGRERFRIAVAGNAGDLEADISRFSWRTAFLLGLVGLGLVVATLVLVRIALAPLERMRRALWRIRSGRSERLEGRFAAEIDPLAQELNALIEANREATERARTHVGNLAHALKTPLSVIVNEARASDQPMALRVVEQAELIQSHLAHHLDRARMVAQRRTIGVVTEVEPVVERLIRAMRRIHEDKNPEITLALDSGLRFRGEREDLEEALGNLLDNACKWCATRVAVSVRALPPDGADDRRHLLARVDDDGPGLDPDQRAAVLARGHRLDEKVPGSGLGLSIVAELAALYGGSLVLAAAPEGGLRCDLRLPAL
ncbi:HAMP domain-containing protein [Siculibacillus lacustris]|uniref:histidine kinase n=1 Tax=Siculibacillus lacustris TaxID=1549641 RepID=A0A4Q9VX60_9HYPH|nr:sensor histidine kinase [Siculibacillus lacustris]TBW40973.1 HAMP domain-containing protein [Siculibacillus lacustris]